MEFPAREMNISINVLRILVALVVVTTICGCSSNAVRWDQRAILDDVTGKPPFVTGHCVVAVDGKPVKRCRDPFVTVIPMVELEPGTHVITVRLTDESGNPMTVSGGFEAGKRYKIKSRDRELSVVETEDHCETAGDG